MGVVTKLLLVTGVIVWVLIGLVALALLYEYRTVRTWRKSAREEELQKLRSIPR